MTDQQAGDDADKLLTDNLAQIKSALRTVKHARLAAALHKDPAAISRWVSGENPEKLDLDDISAACAALGLAIMPARGAVVLTREEHSALLLFAERGLAATKLAA